MIDAATRAAKLRQRDSARKLKQVNVRVPVEWDEAIRMLSRELRAGMILRGFVVADPKTGRVRTII